MNKRRSKSAKWHKAHEKDAYVKQARKEGYRGRAAYKLMELNDKYHLIKPGALVVDLGAAPGSWSQVASNVVGQAGEVLAIDILPIQPIPVNVTIVQGDFAEEETVQQLLDIIHHRPVDVVLSDLSPNLSGVMATDQASTMVLTELAYDFAKETLSEGGNFLCKIFQGEGTDVFIKQIRQNFDSVRMRKPDASRPKSREFYLIATGFKAK